MVNKLIIFATPTTGKTYYRMVHPRALDSDVVQDLIKHQLNVSGWVIAAGWFLSPEQRNATQVEAVTMFKAYLECVICSDDFDEFLVYNSTQAEIVETILKMSSIDYSIKCFTRTPEDYAIQWKERQLDPKKRKHAERTDEELMFWGLVANIDIKWFASNHSVPVTYLPCGDFISFHLFILANF